MTGLLDTCKSLNKSTVYSVIKQKPIFYKYSIDWSIIFIYQTFLLPLLKKFSFSLNGLLICPQTTSLYTVLPASAIPEYTSLYAPGTVTLELIPDRLLAFSILIIFSLAHLGATSFCPFFIGYDHNRLQHLPLLAYSYYRGDTSSSVSQ